MGEMVTWQHDGNPASGYLAVPESGSGPGVVVIQEWWGLVPHIREVCDRFAAEGFVALAPDLYDGQSTTEPDEAGKLMMTMNLEAAVARIGAAMDMLAAHEAVTSAQVGVTGFCMGGGLALLAACRRPDIVGACVPFYGVIPWADAEPDWSTLNAPVLGHFAANDDFFGPAKVDELRQRLDALGKDATLVVHPGVDHAFFNDHRPEVYDEATAQSTWADTLAFLRANVS
jgi:carboxymethylenebutenolidase